VLVSAAMLRPIVVESTEDETAAVSMAELDVFGESLDSAAEWSEYWSVDVQVHRCDLGSSMDGWCSRRTRPTSNVQQH